MFVRTRVRSSMFIALSYDSTQALLELELHNGSILHCEEIPTVLVRAMLKAESKGKFYHRWIKDIFETHVRRDVAGRVFRRAA